MSEERESARRFLDRIHGVDGLYLAPGVDEKTIEAHVRVVRERDFRRLYNMAHAYAQIIGVLIAGPPDNWSAS